MNQLKIRMKILFIILLFISKPGFSQTTHYNPNLDKFAGTWKWISGTDTLTIVLQKQMENTHPTFGPTEAIIGWHKYVKNGQLKESNFQYIGINYTTYFNDPVDDSKVSIVAGSEGASRLRMTTIRDISNSNKSEYGYLTLLSGSFTRAEWKIMDRQGIYMGPSGTIGKITLPKHIILTKQP